MLVPHAAVDEDGNPARRENEIRTGAGDPLVKSVAEPSGMECLADRHLWLGVAVPDKGHAS
jgi:hypothetical protein